NFSAFYVEEFTRETFPTPVVFRMTTRRFGLTLFIQAPPFTPTTQYAEKMAMRHRALVLSLLCTSFVFAQHSQLSPGVGNAVLLATNSIQMDRDTAVLSGDVIVNNLTIGAV